MRLDINNFSDSELLKLISKGKPESDDAFKIVYKRYSNQVHAYCYKLVRDRMAVEDIFQETFIKFYQNASSNKSNSTVSGFLFTIARNLCFNYIRDKKVNVEVEDFHLTYENNDLEQKESYKHVNIAMDLLEIEYREPLILRMYDGLSYNEIAEICNITSETARQRVFRAKEKMKGLLEPYYKIK
jgi:RNA polymerase sigma-70 factor (ECF subfamily)